eukprot:1148719-Pelagomonas_calceolata.AAC.3
MNARAHTHTHTHTHTCVRSLPRSWRLVPQHGGHQDQQQGAQAELQWAPVCCVGGAALKKELARLQKGWHSLAMGGTAWKGLARPYRTGVALGGLAQPYDGRHSLERTGKAL